MDYLVRYDNKFCIVSEMQVEYDSHVKAVYGPVTEKMLLYFRQEHLQGKGGFVTVDDYWKENG